jgi:YhcN/YlaJ family sporulation lipoprotein
MKHRMMIGMAAACASLSLLAACGGGGNAITGDGSNRIQPNSHEERMLTDEKNDDMRLGLDRYKGSTGRFPDSDEFSGEVDRENGITGFDQDGVNRWDDYTDKPMDTGSPSASNMNSAGAADTSVTKHFNGRLEHRSDLSEQVASLGAIRYANVLLSERNAYVAVITEWGLKERSLTEEQRDVISTELKRLEPSIQRVYVSDNAELYRRIDDYVRNTKDGKASSTFVSDFNAFVAELFR